MTTNAPTIERINWAIARIGECDPGIPQRQLEKEIAGRFMVGPTATRGTIVAVLGTPGVFHKNGLICARKSAITKAAQGHA